MKKVRFLSSIVALLLVSVLLLSSCTPKNNETTSSDEVSSETTVSENVTSTPEKETDSSKSEESSEPKTEVSSKPKTEVSSKPHPVVSTKPSSTPSQNNSKVTTQTKPDSERIVGKWSATIDISAGLAAQGFEVSSPANVKAFYEFTANKTAIITLDEASYRNMATPLLEQALRSVVNQQYGTTLEEFATQNNTTIQALIDASMEESVKSLTQTGTYKLEGKNLIITLTATGENDAYTYSFISDDKLSLTSDGETATFTKVK